MAMIPLKRLAATIAIAVSLMIVAGCAIPIPAPPGPEPFPEEKIGSVRSGNTNRAEIVEKLGQPTYRTRDNSVFAYLGGQRVGYLLAGVPGAGDFLEITKDQSLIIEFTPRGAVQHIELLDGLLIGLTGKRRGIAKAVPYCRTNGKCILSLRDTRQDIFDQKNTAMTLFDARKDARAKLFQRHAGKCVAYIFQTENLTFADLMMDDSEIIPLGPRAKVFARLELAPGQHQITNSPTFDVNGLQAGIKPFSFECKASEIVYIRRSRWVEGAFEPTLANAANAQEQIRKLYLTPSYR